MYSPFCTFISYKKNSRARALTKDMGRARKKKYSCANFELKQERTAAMFLSENTNPSNICFFYRDVSKTFWETFHLWLGECSIKISFLLTIGDRLGSFRYNRRFCINHKSFDIDSWVLKCKMNLVNPSLLVQNPNIKPVYQVEEIYICSVQQGVSLFSILNVVSVWTRDFQQ